MGWDGAGAYTRNFNFSADASSGIKILAARMDAELDDFASAMTITLTRNGQNVPTGNLPMGGFRHINVGAPTSVNNYMRSREFIENIPVFMDDTASSADRISVSAQYFTSVSANQAPGDGTHILVRVLSNKSSAALYLNGHSANVHYTDGGRIASAVTSGGIYKFVYSSVDAFWKIENPDQIDSHIKYVRTAAEISAGVTPTNYQYAPGYQERYSTLADLFACGEKTLRLAANTTTTITTKLSVPSNTRIVGHGSNSVIKAGANIVLLEIDGKSNVILENFRVDGDRATYTTSSNYGVYGPANGTGCTNVTVRNVDVVNMGGSGIIFLAQTGSHSNRITIDGCYVYNCGAHGIICQDYVDNTVITNNYVRDFGMTVSDRPGITTGRSASNHTVYGNFVLCSASALGTSVHGISIDDGTYFVCANNVIEDCIGFGIEIGGSREGTVSGNTIVGGDRAHIELGCTSIQVARISITGNVSTNSGDAGILLQKGAGTQVSSVTITGNQINSPAGCGITLEDSSEEIVVVGNQVVSSGTSGIYCHVSNYVVIEGNLIRACNSTANASHAGIRVVNTTSETEYLIDNNRVTGSGVANYTIDNPIIDDGLSHKPAAASFTAADATPSVGLGRPGRVFKTADTTTYTAFDDGRGELDNFYLLALHAAVVTHNSNIKTSTGANKTLTVDVLYHFVSVGGVWYEVATA